MSKIERKYLAHFINTAAPAADGAAAQAVYERLGKDLTEYSPELAAEVSTSQNICGETSVVISSYKKTASVEPYYAESGSGLFTRLQTIIDDGQVLDALKTDVVEVKLWEKGENGAFPAIKEEAFIEVTSYGGDTAGYKIPFKLHYNGVKVKGTFDPAQKTFTPAAAE